MSAIQYIILQDIYGTYLISDSISTLQVLEDDTVITNLKFWLKEDEYIFITGLDKNKESYFIGCIPKEVYGIDFINFLSIELKAPTRDDESAVIALGSYYDYLINDIFDMKKVKLIDDTLDPKYANSIIYWNEDSIIDILNIKIGDTVNNIVLEEEAITILNTANNSYFCLHFPTKNFTSTLFYSIVNWKQICLMDAKNNFNFELF